jgi:hypothetical protein
MHSCAVLFRWCRKSLPHYHGSQFAWDPRPSAFSTLSGTMQAGRPIYQAKLLLPLWQRLRSCLQVHRALRRWTFLQRSWSRAPEGEPTIPVPGSFEHEHEHEDEHPRDRRRPKNLKLRSSGGLCVRICRSYGWMLNKRGLWRFVRRLRGTAALQVGQYGPISTGSMFQLWE